MTALPQSARDAVEAIFLEHLTERVAHRPRAVAGLARHPDTFNALHEAGSSMIGTIRSRSQAIDGALYEFGTPTEIAVAVFDALNGGDGE